MRKQLIAVDLDGTLLDENGSIADPTRAILDRIAALGHPIIPVTGRSFRTAAPLLRSIAVFDQIVCSNGAYCYQLSLDTIHWSETIDPSLGQDLITRFKRALPDACFGWETEDGICYQQAFIDLATAPLSSLPIVCKDIIDDSPLYKLYVRSPSHDPYTLCEIVQSIAGTTAEATTSGAPFVELSAAGVNKGSGLARIATGHGIAAEDTIAFGDNHNDIPMLEWAGLAIAMANADPVAKAKAHHVTASNRDHGVAVFLANHFALG